MIRYRVLHAGSLLYGLHNEFSACFSHLLLRSKEFGGVFPVLSFFNWISDKFLPLVHSARRTTVFQAVKNGIFSALAYVACIGGVLLVWALFWL